jgi:DNA-damage-inducible protein D
MNTTIFEQIKKLNEHYQEFWSARELAKVLEYDSFRNFLVVVEKAKIACKQSSQQLTDHFVDANNMIELAKSAKRQVEDIQLSRYACYLIIQNADPRKEIVALGQTYFAIQTRRQEVNEQFLADKDRLLLRDELTFRNKKLFSTAKKS